MSLQAVSGTGSASKVFEGKLRRGPLMTSDGAISCPPLQGAY